ncbi:MAG: nuclease [Phycisphaerales bacterium]|nr:nuclease [Phycisphaerales bacterium]
MAQRTPPEAIARDAVSIALRQRRIRLVGIGLAIVTLGCTSIWSHRNAPPDPSKWEGMPVVVDRVIDGDTIVISGDGFNHERLRLRGIDAPEVAHPEHEHDDHFGPEARRYLEDRLTKARDAGKPITLKFDGTERRDRYDRILGYVYLGDSDCINVDLVRDGMAYVDRRFKSMLQSTLEQDETNARTKGIGVWQDLKPEDMPEWRQRWLAKLNRVPAK